jgi:hypothetical protein
MPLRRLDRSLQAAPAWAIRCHISRLPLVGVQDFLTAVC